MTTDTVLHHVRQAPRRSRPRTDSSGQFRRPVNYDWDKDPRGHTLCGAEPTSWDLSNREGKSKKGRPYVTCQACLAIIDAAKAGGGG